MTLGHVLREKVQLLLYALDVLCLLQCHRFVYGHVGVWNVKDRYIHYEKYGDQFCGKSVIGISSLCKEFAVSPVYFELGSALT